MSSTYMQLRNNLNYLKLSQMNENLDEILDYITKNNLSLTEGLIKLTQIEIDHREKNMIKSMVKVGAFPHHKELRDFDFDFQSSINKQQILDFETLRFIENCENIVFLGNSGVGKTWISNALGVHSCRSRKRVKYIRLPELLMDLETARIQGAYRKMMKQLGKLDLLIIDEFLLSSVNETEVNSILEIMELRCNKKSTILCSQWTPEGWYQKLGGGPIADAILDRIINSSYKILLENTSMREEYSKLK